MLSLWIWPATPWATEIYKSVDADGHVTYSDRPTMSNLPSSPVDSALPDDTNEISVIRAPTPPPPLPIDDQPPCPEDGDLWTPGYWVWDGVQYAWVAGVWVFPPGVLIFWTPGYWAFVGNVFIFHRGYWGPQVGYYGGINYGYGYPGTGYVGGRWEGRVFAYNRAVNHLDTGTLRHVYDEPQVSRASVSRVSYNGGPGGTSTVASAQERLAAQSRMISAPERMHLQPNPGPGPNVSYRSGQSTPGTRPATSRTPPPSVSRRSTVSTAPPPQAPANTAVRPAPSASKTTRPRATPTIRSGAIK
jgi:hypothetical protein